MGPMSGVKVIEIASLAPAPFGCTILADMGADVLRIDRSRGGGLAMPPGVLDRGRRTIAVDLKSAEGVQVVHDLVAAADVLVEGFRPGVAERLGIGPERLCESNPRLIYGRMTGWGQDGPLASRAGHDINYIAVAGALEPLGRAGARPHAPANLLADFAGGGLMLALGVAAALYERDRSGEGQVIDAAMVDGAALLTSFMHGMHANGLWEGERGTNALDGAASFYDTYETSDGKFMAVGSVEPQFYRLLLGELGLDDPDLPFQLDADAWPHMKKLIGDTFRQRTRAEWTMTFADSDACVSPVLSPWEARNHPHNQARGTFIDVAGVCQPAPAPRFSRSANAHPVPVDEGGRDVISSMKDWGIPDAAAARLRQAGIVT